MLCQEYPNAKIKFVVFDLAADNTKAGLRQRRKDIEGLDVGVMINNTGVADGNEMMSDKIEIETWMNTIKVDVRSLTEMTHSAAGMQKRKTVAVVNIGSGSILFPPPYSLFAAYTRTKEYTDQFSGSLEHKGEHFSLVATKRVS